MTLQEIFDKVATHLLTQNARAQAPNGTYCYYRAPGGLTCAVGCLISDEAYQPQIEGVGVGNDRVSRVVAQSIGQVALSERQQSLLASLQNIHDEVDPDRWPEALRKVAIHHKFQYGHIPGLTQGASQ